MGSGRIHAGHAELKALTAEASLTVGDQVTLELHVVHDGHGQVSWPTVEALQGLLAEEALVVGEARASGPAPATLPGLSEGEAVEEVCSFTLQVLLAPGEHELGPFPVSVVAEGGKELDALELPAAGLEVVSVLDQETVARLEAAPDPAAAAAELAPPRGPWSLGSELPLAALAGTGLAFMALLALLLWWWKRRPKTRRLVEPEPLVPAEVVARERLSHLPALLDTGEVFAFHVALAEILKVYLGRRHDADFVDSTTLEVRTLLHGSLRRGAAVTQTRDTIHRILSSCDLVKFAEDRPDRRACLAALESTRDVVERSTLAAEESASRDLASSRLTAARPMAEPASGQRGLS